MTPQPNVNEWDGGHDGKFHRRGLFASQAHQRNRVLETLEKGNTRSGFVCGQVPAGLRREGVDIHSFIHSFIHC